MGKTEFNLCMRFAVSQALKPGVSKNQWVAMPIVSVQSSQWPVFFKVD